MSDITDVLPTLEERRLDVRCKIALAYFRNEQVDDLIKTYWSIVKTKDALTKADEKVAEYYSKEPSRVA